MFGFGGLSEVLFILFLAMLIFGRAKMPEIARMLAKGMAEVRKASNELKRTLNAELAISEQEKEAARLHSQAAAPFPPPPPPAPPAWSGGQTVPQLDATVAPEAPAPASGAAGGSEAAAGGGEAAAGGSEAAAGGGEAAAGDSEAAAGGSEGAASSAGRAGSEVAPGSDDAALTTDAAYYAAWPEEGSSPHAAADSASPEPAAATATAAPDGRHTA